MIFSPTAIDGVLVVDLHRIEDERGFFARSFCQQEFIAAGIEPTVRQGNLSFNRHPGTLRGMHFQRDPHKECKLVRCTRGAIFDVAVDLRPASPTYLHYVGERLDLDNRRALYVPSWCAHGYLTLEPDTEVSYLVSEDYAPGSGGGVGFDDPKIGIDWPGPVTVVSEQDRSWPRIKDVL